MRQGHPLRRVQPPPPTAVRGQRRVAHGRRLLPDEPAGAAGSARSIGHSAAHSEAEAARVAPLSDPLALSHLVVVTYSMGRVAPRVRRGCVVLMKLATQPTNAGLDNR